MIDAEVIYIAHRSYGAVALDRFFSSYCRYAAGLPHRVTIAMKDFVEVTDQFDVIDRARRIGAIACPVPDGGLDIGTYLRLAGLSNAEVLCFFNSNSEILADRWLEKLVSALSKQNGGAVAATGSFESHYSDQYRLLPGQNLLSRLRPFRFVQQAARFAPFPNPHLRTNALAIRRKDLLQFGFREPRDKEEAWLFESGRRGLSASLLRGGGVIKVVGADGRSFEVMDWPSSDTFWAGRQGNLLVADNQTRRFDEGSHELRARLQQLAWERPRLELGHSWRGR